MTPNQANFVGQSAGVSSKRSEVLFRYLPTRYTNTHIHDKSVVGVGDGRLFRVIHTSTSCVLASDVTPSEPKLVDAIRVGG
jgi:hypothetical protein